MCFQEPFRSGLLSTRAHCQTVRMFLLLFSFLHKVTGSCYTPFSEWKLYKINGFTLPDAISCWLPKPGRQPSPSCTGKRKLIDNCSYPSCNTQCPHVITHHGSQRYDMEGRYNSYVASRPTNGIGYDSGTRKQKQKQKQKQKDRKKEN